MVEETIEATAVLEAEEDALEPVDELDRFELYIDEFREAIRRKLPPGG